MLCAGYRSGRPTAKDGKFDVEGFKNVLKLRTQFEGGTPNPPEKYVDFSYYQKALAGL